MLKTIVLIGAAVNLLKHKLKNNIFYPQYVDKQF